MKDRHDGRRESYHHGDLRQALLDAAEEELKQKGIEGFTLRGCAKRAGVSHAAPAHHFRDADALLTALAETAFRRFVAAMKSRRLTAHTDPGAQLVAIGLGYIDFATEDPALFKLMFDSDRPDFSDPALGRSATSAYRMLVEAVCAAKASDDEAAAAPDIAAAWGIVHGLAELANADRLQMFSALDAAKRDAVFRDIIARVIPKTGTGPDEGRQAQPQ